MTYPRGEYPPQCFLTHPGIPKESKLTMQAELHLLIVHILRKYPSLSYFQVSPGLA